MVILRGTVSLLKRLRLPIDGGEPTGVLGDWYAKVVATRPRVLVLCTNERSLLSVVVALAPSTGFLDRFRAAAAGRIAQIQAHASRREAEITAVSSVRLGRTRNRSVLSSLNQFAFAAEAWLAEQPEGDLEELGLWLCDTPCFPLETKWPWREAQLLLGAGS